MRPVLPFLTFLTALLPAAKAAALTITTLNLQWFGQGGVMEGHPADEYRSQYVKELVDSQLQKTDVFVFEEVMDVEVLRKALPGLTCKAYEEDRIRHQHVAFCWKLNQSVSVTTVESVRLGQSGLRPAVRAEFKTAAGKTIAFYGVHLKAGSDASTERMRQMQALRAAIPAGENAVLTGDFNTFTKDKTGLPEDDHVTMQAALGAEFAETGGTRWTYIGNYPGRVFDRVWARGVSVSNFNVQGPCTFPQQWGRLYKHSFYTRFVSDHCPVSFTVD